MSCYIAFFARGFFIAIRFSCEVLLIQSKLRVCGVCSCESPLLCAARVVVFIEHFGIEINWGSQTGM